MKKVNIPDSVGASKIVTHGKITNLTVGFHLPNGEGFSIYARPKSGASITTSDIVLSVKCMGDENPSEIPVILNEWNKLYLESIAPDNEILTNVDLYWGAGCFITKGKGKYYIEPSAKSLRYSGEAQELITAGSGTGTIKYRVDGGAWSENVPTATNVGVYEVEYKMEGNDLYESVEVKTLRCTIIEKFVNDPTIELTPSSFTYNGESCIPSVVVKDGQRVIPANEYTVEITNNVNAGTANVVIKDNTAGNYEVLGSTIFVIAKADASCVAPTEKSDLVYDGTEKSLVDAGTASGGTLQYSLNNEDWSEEIPTAINAGDYSVYYKVVGDANHNDIAAASVSVSIAKASRTLTFTTAPSSVNTSETIEVTAQPSAGGGEVSYSSSDTEIATVEGNIVTGVAAGTCNILASIAADSNYESVTTQYELSVV